MAKGKIFEFAILRHPMPDNPNDKPLPSVLVQEPKYILAQDQQQATILAAREIPEESLDKLEEVEIAVRPF